MYQMGSYFGSHFKKARIVTKYIYRNHKWGIRLLHTVIIFAMILPVFNSATVIWTCET